MKSVVVNACRIALPACLIVFTLAVPSASAQRKTKPKTTPKKSAAAAPANELTKLRDEYIKSTNEYKTSLEKLIAIYETNVKKAEDELTKSQKLFDAGLISKLKVAEYEQAVAAQQEKLDAARRQMTEADEQIAAILVETEAEKTIAKNLKLARQSLVRTTAFVRYAGNNSGWNLGEAWKVQRFFSDTFKKQLPVAVFGQGAIHDRWRLDHRNSMDISLHPDSAEGQALLNFLQQNGIPYLAFRSAIPGTATGPHIHIGRPSHRY